VSDKRSARKVQEVSLATQGNVGSLGMITDIRLKRTLRGSSFEVKSVARKVNTDIKFYTA